MAYDLTRQSILSLQRSLHRSARGSLARSALVRTWRPVRSRATGHGGAVKVHPLPRATADALAGFVEERARPSRLLAEDAGVAKDAARAGWGDVAVRYRQAVREGRELSADNLAHALLDIAVQHREHHDFQPGWLHWHEVLKGLEDEPV